MKLRILMLYYTVFMTASWQQLSFPYYYQKSHIPEKSTALFDQRIMQDVAKVIIASMAGVIFSKIIMNLNNFAEMKYHSHFNSQKTKPRYTFKDFAGTISPEIEIIVEFIKNPQKYGHLGAELPSGCLLMGPPGNGKTLLAEAVAGETGANFFYISASALKQMWLGQSSKMVQNLFAAAQKNKSTRSIIFIDEADSLILQRKENTHAEDRATLNSLLTCIDGIGSSKNVFVIMATNASILSIDKAIESRLSYKIVLENPDKNQRLAIIQHYLKIYTSSEALKNYVQELVTQTDGFSARDIRNLINSAALIAGHEDAHAVDIIHITKALSDKQKAYATTLNIDRL